MINEWIVRLSPWILGLAALGFVLIVWAAVRAFRLARSGPYYVIRQQARRRGFGLIGVAAAILVGGIALGLCSLANKQRLPVSTPLPVPSPTWTVQLPTATSLPTSSPTPTSSATPAPPTATATATPSPTRSPDLPPPLLTLTPLPSIVPSATNASFGSITFTAGPSEKCPPRLTGPASSEFLVGVPKICAYFQVYNMIRNSMWMAAWYKDGKYIAGEPLLWDGPASGLGIAFYAEPGRQAGRWELRLYIEDRLQSTGTFTVSVPAVTPTPAPGG